MKLNQLFSQIEIASILSDRYLAFLGDGECQGGNSKRIKTMIANKSGLIITFILIVGGIIAGCSSFPYHQNGLSELSHPDIFKWRFNSQAENVQPPLDEKPIKIQLEPDTPVPKRPATPSSWRPLPFSRVFFDYNKAELKPNAKEVIKNNAAFLKRNPDYQILIEGHCDERGTPEYNMALGQRRAIAVKQFMVSLGIAESRIETKSWGEELPIDLGHNEDAWRLNRRAEMYYSML